MSSPTTLGAIVALFTANSTLTADFAATGGLWVGGIPEERAALPAVALMDFHEAPDWTLDDTTVIDTGEFSLIVYAVDLAAAETLATHVKTVYDPVSGGGFKTLSITNGVTAFLKRTDYSVKLVEYRAADSSWVYEITMPFHTYVQRRL